MILKSERTLPVETGFVRSKTPVALVVTTQDFTETLSISFASSANNGRRGSIR